MPLRRTFAKWAAATLAYHVLVILWGAVVRVSFSGDGCGDHWPGCNDELIPTHGRPETFVEFSHRATSGLAVVFVALLLVAAYRTKEAKHIRNMVWTSLFFDGMEAVIGMALVKLKLVAHNPSLKRAVSGSLHLVNTFFLLAALTLVVLWSLGIANWKFSRQKVITPLLAISAFGILLLAMSGAVAAFGDTVYHANSLEEGMRADFQATSALLLRLRVLHPTFAVIFGIAIIASTGVARWLRPDAARASRMFVALFITQFAFGLANLTFLAPAWMQIVHLLLAQSVWIAFVAFAATALAEERSAA